jgi:hypothetical protein
VRWFFLLLCGASAAPAAKIVADEPNRLAALAAAFPGTTVALAPAAEPAPSQSAPARGVAAADLVGFHDVFKDEQSYLVTGPPGDNQERCAAEDVSTRALSKTRHMRFRLYEIGGADYVLIVQYKFDDVVSAGSCWSIGRVIALQKSGAAWHRRDEVTLPMQHHGALETIEFPRIGHGNRASLLIESDVAGPGTVETVLKIFSISSGKLDELLSVTGRIAAPPPDTELYYQTLSVPLTLKQHGFCFNKTTLAESGVWLHPTRVTTECYPQGTGVMPR